VLTVIVMVAFDNLYQTNMMMMMMILTLDHF